MQPSAILTLARPIAGYFPAEALSTGEIGTDWFAADAQVHDEGRSHKGHEAITAWKAAGKAKTQYVVEPLTQTEVDGGTLVSARVSGNFPGSPVILTYRFTLANDRIVDLDIRP